MDTNDNLIQIAREIGDYLAQRLELKKYIRTMENALDQRKIELTPDEGWEGKNVAARDFTRDSVFADDDLMRSMKHIDEINKENLSRTETGLEILIVERRAIEWQIRNKMADAQIMIANPILVASDPNLAVISDPEAQDLQI